MRNPSTTEHVEASGGKFLLGQPAAAAAATAATAAAAAAAAANQSIALWIQFSNSESRNYAGIDAR